MSLRIAQLIQKQAPLGSRLVITLKTGKSVEGQFAELARDYIVLERNGNATTVLLDMIGAWDVDGQEDSLSIPSLAAVNNQQHDSAPVALVQQQAGRVNGTHEVIAEPAIEVGAQSDSPKASDEAVLKTLVEIETRYDTQIHNSRIEIKPPGFDLSPSDVVRDAKTKDTKMKVDKDAERVSEKLWGNIINQYNYAKKVNELGSQFGRIQPIISELEKLRDRLPKSAIVLYHLAYLYYLRGDRNIALNCYKTSAQLSSQADTWRNLAVLAGETENYALACYALEQLLTMMPVEGKSNEWYTYIGLVYRLRGYSSLRKVFTTHGEGQDLAPVLEATIYLTSREYGKKRAEEVVRHWLNQIDLYKLVIDILEDIEGQSSNESINILAGFASTPNSGESTRLSTKLPQTQHSQIQTYSIAELYRVAKEYAAEANYSQAISSIKQVLNLDPGYQDAGILHERWREYARVSGVPSGSNPYAQARRVQLVEKDLDRAAKLFRQAIKERDNVESAIKDLAQLLVQQSQTDQAIDLLQQQRKAIQDQQSVDNLLVSIYQKAGRYGEAIEILRKRLLNKLSPEKVASLHWQIGYLYLQAQQYKEALKEFSEVEKLQPTNLTVQRNIALCYFNMGQYDRAEATVNTIYDGAADAKVIELLEAIKQARQSGRYAKVIVNASWSDLSGELSKFSQFLLDRCDYQGVPTSRVQTGKFESSDIQTLERLAVRLGARRPRERAGYYLSAAKIVLLTTEERTSQFYKYLCRSLTSSADAIVAEGRPLSTAREYYCEALAAIDRAVTGSEREPDAIYSIVRFLFSTLGASEVPLTPQIPSIEESLEKVLVNNPQSDYVLENIAYLITWSRFAANEILKPIFMAATLQAITLRYLGKYEILPSHPSPQFDEFVHLLHELRRRRFEQWRIIADEFRFLKKSELSAASLENGIKRLKDLTPQMINDLDQKRTRDIQGIIEIGLELVKQTTFEERERLCTQIGGRCDDLLEEIETNPTKFSIEEMYDVVDALRNKSARYLDELYSSSTPQVDTRLPIESYTPDFNRRISVQIVVINKMGQSPAESLKLIIPADDKSYSSPTETRLEGSLRGGEQRILVMDIQLTPVAIQAETFSLPVYARYSTRSGKIENTPVFIFSIRLYPENEFERIDNPYVWAEGGPVSDARMFYGREELIENITTTVLSPNSAGKSIIVFGQKRAGKSSILYHLKQKLIQGGEILILDVGNIGSILDKQSTIPFLYQILWTILIKLQYAIEDAVIDNGKPPLSLFLPTDREFYAHPSPLTLFRDLWMQFRREATRINQWQGCKVVLLIDEFSYIFSEIVHGHIPETFMKNWKAILQDGWFCAVLAGQDDMPRFKQRFPNEFGTTQDERVTYLKREDAEKLIDEPIRIGARSGESRYREHAIDRIIDLTAGSPFYIQILCNRLVEHMNRRKARLVTEADVEQVKNELIRGVNALSFDKFENLINSGDKASNPITETDVQNVLQAIALNSEIGLCNRSSIICKTATPIDEILDDLVKRDVIERERGQYYRIRVGLFKEWLLANG